MTKNANSELDLRGNPEKAPVVPQAVREQADMAAARTAKAEVEEAPEPAKKAKKTTKK